MTERGILFKGELVRAILAGQKTQTRRLVKPTPVEMVRFLGRDGQPTGEFGWCPHERVITKHVRCPYGVPGGRLWVRETWCPEYESDGSYLYRATISTPVVFPEGGRWRPSIHMPRRASRIALEITDVRAQRLQEITEEDAQAEGFTAGGRMEFAMLWDAINGKRASWESNPWVWAITFRRILP